MRDVIGLSVALMFLGACGDDEQARCGRWKAAAKTYAECYPLAYPPTDDDEGITCVDDAEVSDRSMGQALLSDLDTIDACIEYLGQKKDTCRQPNDSGYSRLETIERVTHCTGGVVATWPVPSSGSACDRWKKASAYRSYCDPALFGVPVDSATCVADDEVSSLTDGQFETVGECADYLFDLAFPCEIPLATRELCADLLVSD